jgi:hypothetical protein
MSSRRWGMVLFCLVCLGLAPSGVRAQSTEPDFQQWLQLWVPIKLPKGFLLDLDLQARRMNAPLAAQRDADGALVGYRQSPNTGLLLRPFAGYQLTSWGSLWVGYAWTPVFFDDPAQRDARNVSEHRVFQQLLTSNTLGGWDLLTRTRLEQRVRSNGPGSAENDAGMDRWAHRARAMLRASYTFGATPWMAVVWDEAFFHLNDTNYPTRQGFDQNRAFAGVGYQASKDLRVELGYLNQYVKRYTDPNQLNHVLFTMVQLKFDLSGAGAP